MDRVKEDDYILLVKGDIRFIIRKSQRKFSCNDGLIDLTKIRHFGQCVSTNKKVKYIAIKPTIIDLLSKCRRMPQIIMPKDAGQIVAVTGAGSGWKCVDAGAGSGFLSIFLGHAVSPSGSVTSYEKRKEFFANVKKNIKLCGLENIVKVRNADATKGIKEKSLDLVTLDMTGAEKVVKHAFNALKLGGWLAVYSPHIEQQKAVVCAMQGKFSHIKTIENIQRSWQVSDFTHPHPSQVVHTGFLTFGRKV